MDTDSTFTLGCILTRLAPDAELKGGNLLISILNVLMRNQHLVFDPRCVGCLFYGTLHVCVCLYRSSCVCVRTRVCVCTCMFMCVL